MALQSNVSTPQTESKNRVTRAEERTPRVKGLLCSSDNDQSSARQHSRKSWMCCQESVTPEMKRQRQMDTGGLVANQASQIGELRVQ